MSAQSAERRRGVASSNSVSGGKAPEITFGFLWRFLLSEFLAHLHMINRALRRQHARIQLKAVHFGQAELRLRMAAQKRLKRLLGNAFRSSKGDMRTKGLEIRFETRIKDRILNAPMERKEMRMPFSHTCPGHRWAAARVEDTDAAQRQKKRRHPHLPQSLAQPILRWCFHISQKAERQMKLFLGKPAQTAQMRVEREQRRLATRRKFEANEKSFQREHPQE